MSTAASPTPSPKVRTTIIKVPDATPGLLFINGQQRGFTLERLWQSPVAPTANMPVDVELDSTGAILSIKAVDGAAAKKEQMDHLKAQAAEQGKAAAAVTQKGVLALAEKMGWLSLGAEVLFVIGFFAFPAAGASGPVAGAVPSLSFWGLLGIDFGNPMLSFAGGSDHGFFAMIGALMIFLPLAVPFIKQIPYSKYLSAGPLAVVAIGGIWAYMQANKAFGELKQIGADNPFGLSWGFYLLVVLGLVLALPAIKKDAA
jgi:hypothetical protein